MSNRLSSEAGEFRAIASRTGSGTGKASGALALICLFLILAVVLPSGLAAEPKTLPWLDNLAEAHRRALAEKKPVLIRVGASWCPPCHSLAAEIERPSVQEALGRWMLVYLEAEQDDVAGLGVTSIPALRIQTPAGEAVASSDGFLKADELVEWLKKYYEEASAEADDVLLATGEPNASAVIRLVRQIHQRNPAMREAAIHRLTPFPKQACVVVARTFEEGNLAGRLAAMELLAAWHAPVDGLDPWQPETLTAKRLASLKDWAQGFQTPAKREPKQPSPEQRAEAGHEMDRMLKVDAREAEAIRHRLAGLGASLLPDVAARLQQATADEDRRRLAALRYRLVAADSLILRWPGGLERLADTDPRERRRAADELAQRASGDEQPLLVELFADSDPLVREFSLRGLQNIGGVAAATSLVKLLADPEPNVRAAVLKQLEENPLEAMVPLVANYVKQEKDPDLVVHAIRFLRTAGGSASARTLIALLKHESWQVRAEAAQSLKKSDTFRSHSRRRISENSDAGEKLQIDVYVALLEMLNDPDAFVVSRVVEGLSGVDMEVAVEPLVRAAARHPELTSQVVELLAHGRNMQKPAVVELRKFRKNADPRVRAAALSGLHQAQPDNVSAEVLVGLRDTDAKVRRTAAQIVFQVAESKREQAQEKSTNRNRYVAAPVASETSVTQTIASTFASIFGLGSTTVVKVEPSTTPQAAQKSAPVATPSTQTVAPAVTPSTQTIEPVVTAPTKRLVSVVPMPPQTVATLSPATPQKTVAFAPVAAGTAEAPAEKQESEPIGPRMDRWLREFYSGKGRPAWLTATIGPLETMLQSQDPEQQLAAAMALVPLGKSSVALPVILKTAKAGPDKSISVSGILPWLVWEERLKVFRQLYSSRSSDDGLSYLMYKMNEVPDPRGKPLLWELLDDPKIVVHCAGELERGLMAAYTGERYYSSNSSSSKGKKPSLKEMGRDALLHVGSGSELRRVVAMALLSYADPEQAIATAHKIQSDPKSSPELMQDAFHIVLALEDKKQANKLAVAALAGRDAVQRKVALEFLVHGGSNLRQLRESVYIDSPGNEVVFTNGQPNVAKPPAGLDATVLRPLLTDRDGLTAARAGYLMTLLGEPEGLKPFLLQARKHMKEDDRWRDLVVQAIAAADDSTQIPLLKEIYEGLDQYEVSRFYWTIRAMTGPEILKFRKQIRDTVGMSRLR